MSHFEDGTPPPDACSERGVVTETTIIDRSSIDHPSNSVSQSSTDTHSASSSRERESNNTSVQADHQAGRFKQENTEIDEARSRHLPRGPSVYFVEPVSTHTHTAIVLLNGLADHVDTFISLCLPPIAIQFPNWRWVFPLAVSGLSHPEGNWFMRS